MHLHKIIYSLLGGPIYHLLTLGPIWSILCRTLQSQIFFYYNPVSTKKLSDCLPHKIYGEFSESSKKLECSGDCPFLPLILFILNPAFFIARLLFFLQASIFYIIEIGSDFDSRNSKIRLALKAPIILAFTLMQLVTNIAARLIQLPIKLLQHLVIDPLLFIIQSFIQLFSEKSQIVQETSQSSRESLTGGCEEITILERKYTIFKILPVKNGEKEKPLLSAPVVTCST